jgi:hypothetical protein
MVTSQLDLFVVPTIGFDLLYVFVIIRLDRRQLVWINVTTNPTAEWIARQLTEALPWAGTTLPRPGSGSCLQRCHHALNSRCGHTRQAHRTSIAVAERFCRTVDWINPARMCGPYRRLGRGAFALDLASLCPLLQ